MEKDDHSESSEKEDGSMNKVVISLLTPRKEESIQADSKLEILNPKAAKKVAYLRKEMAVY